MPSASAASRDDPLPPTLYLDAQLGLVDDMLHYFDRASMAHSLEVRVPFLDHELVEFCATIPRRTRCGASTRSTFSSEAARGLVPDRIIDKPKIGFFHTRSTAGSRRRRDGAIGDYLLGPRPRYAEMLDRGRVERLVRDHAAGPTGGHGRAPPRRS